PAPDEYAVQVRYSIFASGNPRIRQFNEMAVALREAGFARAKDDAPDDEPENPKYTRMLGTIPRKGVARLLEQRHVRALLLHPKDATLPEKGTRVRVSMQLAGGFQPETQRKLARQTVRVLARDAGFVEAVGYDRAGDTRLVGSMPVENLDRVLEDVRR